MKGIGFAILTAIKGSPVALCLLLPPRLRAFVSIPLPISGGHCFVLSFARRGMDVFGRMQIEVLNIKIAFCRQEFPVGCPVQTGLFTCWEVTNAAGPFAGSGITLI